MPSDPATLRSIAWMEIFPWLHLVRTVRMALRVRLLCLATVALLLTICGWAAIGYLFSGSEDPAISQWRRAYASCPWQAQQADPTLPDMVRPLFFNESLFAPPALGEFPQSPYFDAWWQLSAPFRQLFSPHLTYVSLAFILLCLLWVVVVWAFFGGAIARIAALELTRHEQIGWKPALRHAREKFPAYFSAPLMPLLGVLLITLPILVLGLLMRLDVGLLVAGIVWPVVLVGGLLMGIILLGLLFGWPLMWGAIGTESSDTFDALSRSYSYVHQRPYHYLFYALVASFLGILGGLLVYYFASAVTHLVLWAASWGSGNARLTAIGDPAALGTLASWGVQLIMFWNGVALLVAVGFVYSYFWSASTAIYLLLRYHVDGTEMDEAYVDDATGPHGLPPLATDAAGVPVVPPDEIEADE